MIMKYFIFDLGSVVVKPMKIEEIYNSFNWNIDYEKFKDIFSNSKSAKEIHKGIISTEEYFDFLKQYSTDDISFEEFVEAYKKSKQDPYEDTINIIKSLKEKGYPVCLLSNLRKIDFGFYQEKFDPMIFDHLFLSYELNMLKPDQEIYEKVIKNLNVEANQLYFFDDLLENVEAARAIGINAYQVTGENIKEIFEKEIYSII